MEFRKATMGAFKCCLLFLSILLIACQGLQTVAPKHRIALLQGGPHAGSWESNDVYLEYQYVRQPGIIKLSISIKAKFRFNQLSVWVSFLDSEGKILETKSIYNSGYLRESSRERRYKGSVEKTFEMPTETNHLAFRSSLQPYTDTNPM
jgi:hypothetical protein